MNCKEHTPAITATLRGNKMKATQSRIQLLDVFEHAKKPLSVTELVAKIPSSDRATLYRNVESLEQSGILKQVRFKDRQAYYEIESNHHHHIICTHCGKISDVAHCKISISEKELLKNTGFAEVSDHSLEFYGYCDNCKKSV
jgi:Fe2+ or Zn2+ uptake regulation protein